MFHKSFSSRIFSPFVSVISLSFSFSISTLLSFNASKRLLNRLTSSSNFAFFFSKSCRYLFISAALFFSFWRFSSTRAISSDLAASSCWSVLLSLKDAKHALWKESTTSFIEVFIGVVGLASTPSVSSTSSRRTKSDDGNSAKCSPLLVALIFWTTFNFACPSAKRSSMSLFFSCNSFSSDSAFSVVKSSLSFRSSFSELAFLSASFVSASSLSILVFWADMSCKAWSRLIASSLNDFSFSLKSSLVCFRSSLDFANDPWVCSKSLFKFWRSSTFFWCWFLSLFIWSLHAATSFSLVSLSDCRVSCSCWILCADKAFCCFSSLFSDRRLSMVPSASVRSFWLAQYFSNTSCFLSSRDLILSSSFLSSSCRSSTCFCLLSNALLVTESSFFAVRRSVFKLAAVSSLLAMITSSASLRDKTFPELVSFSFNSSSHVPWSFVIFSSAAIISLVSLFLSFSLPSWFLHKLLYCSFESASSSSSRFISIACSSVSFLSAFPVVSRMLTFSSSSEFSSRIFASVRSTSCRLFLYVLQTAAFSFKSSSTFFLVSFSEFICFFRFSTSLRAVFDSVCCWRSSSRIPYSSVLASSFSFSTSSNFDLTSLRVASVLSSSRARACFSFDSVSSVAIFCLSLRVSSFIALKLASKWEIFSWATNSSFSCAIFFCSARSKFESRVEICWFARTSSVCCFSALVSYSSNSDSNSVHLLCSWITESRLSKFSSLRASCCALVSSSKACFWAKSSFNFLISSQSFWEVVENVDSWLRRTMNSLFINSTSRWQLFVSCSGIFASARKKSRFLSVVRMPCRKFCMTTSLSETAFSPSLGDGISSVFRTSLLRAFLILPFISRFKKFTSLNKLSAFCCCARTFLVATYKSLVRLCRSCSSSFFFASSEWIASSFWLTSFSALAFSKRVFSSSISSSSFFPFDSTRFFSKASFLLMLLSCVVASLEISRLARFNFCCRFSSSWTEFLYRSSISDKSFFTCCNSSASLLFSEVASELFFCNSAIVSSAFFFFFSIITTWLFAMSSSSCSVSHWIRASFFSASTISRLTLSLSLISFNFLFCLSASEIVRSTSHFALDNAMISVRNFSFSVWKASFVASISHILAWNDLSSLAIFVFSSSALCKSLFSFSSSSL